MINHVYIKRVLICLLFAVIVQVSGSLLAGETGEAKQEVKTEQATPVKAAETKVATPAANGAAGMVVTINPDTGRPEATPQLSPELRDALRDLINHSGEGLNPVTLRDGTVVLDLQGRFQSASVVTVGKDGKLNASCISAPPAASEKADQPKKK